MRGPKLAARKLDPTSEMSGPRCEEQGARCKELPGGCLVRVVSSGLCPGERVRQTESEVVEDELPSICKVHAACMPALSGSDSAL